MIYLATTQQKMSLQLLGQLAFGEAVSWQQYSNRCSYCTLEPGLGKVHVLYCRRNERRPSPLSGNSPNSLHVDDANFIPPVRTTSKVYAELSPLQSQASAFVNPYLTPTRTVSYVPTTPLGKQVAASADAIRRRLLQTPASEARHAASLLASSASM